MALSLGCRRGPLCNPRHEEGFQLVYEVTKGEGERMYEYPRLLGGIFGRNGTSTVVTLIPAGFHLVLFHPSTHIAPRLNKLTVPSPSPIFTPLRTYSNDEQPDRQECIPQHLGASRLVCILVIDTTWPVQG